MTKVDVTFSAEQVNPLPTGRPATAKPAAKTMPANVGGRNVTVALYRAATGGSGSEPDAGSEVAACLIEGDAVYGIGVVGSLGVDSVTVSTVDYTGDGISEISIAGGMGATYGQMKIIGYSAARNRWEEWYSAGSARLLDLEQDGKPELIEDSTGSLPPYVIIHRWRGDHFERLDIASATGGQAATLADAGNRISFSVWQDGKEKRYLYQGGSLYQVSAPR